MTTVGCDIDLGLSTEIKCVNPPTRSWKDEILTYVDSIIIKYKGRNKVDCK